MKKLMRVKLINWHRFTNNTIEIGDSTLISGENGAGKSTFLDAIQFVVTCSNNYFNKAAHENGKRKLTGYIRCKTGRENKPYERSGEISAHVALEFYEESRQRYFIVGAVIDSTSEGQEKWTRYLMDGVRMEEEMFFLGKTPRSISQFRVANAKRIKTWCTTDKDAKVMMRNRFGRIEDKFFRLIPKAMAFRPIDDIKDFVYSYVLDEKEVNIHILRENVRTYQDMQKTLENVKIRIERLSGIERYHEQVVEGLKKDRMYEYFLGRVEADLISEEILRLEHEVKSAQYRLEEQQSKAELLGKEKRERQEIRDNLRVELLQDKDFIARDEQKKRMESLQDRKEELLAGREILMKSVKEARNQIKALLKVKDVDDCVRRYQELLLHVEEMTELAQFKETLQEVVSYKKKMYEKVHRKKAEVSIKINEIDIEKRETEQRIGKLKEKKMSYPEEVSRVMEAVKAEFIRIGRTPEPRVLCELLEIEDEEWRNAVEGYLNTQRFYILVEPENFDIALGTYDRLRKERKAYGVGLINTQKLEEYTQAPEGSLATIVTSQNIYAKQFINMILGKVHMCNHYSELKKYSVSITKECMKYQNHVASAIKPVIYETPYIGRNAVKVQLEQAICKEKELEKLLKEQKERYHKGA